jgi:transposase
MSVKEELRMSIKEADRLGVMKLVSRKCLTIAKAAEQLGVSLRQAKRIRKRYKREGAQGLISRRIGQPNINKTAESLRSKAVGLIRKKYPDFGPTLAGEKLIERHHIKFSSETLRKWMIEEGIWISKRKKEKKVYQRRARRSRFGELLQGDGSPHDWFEGRGEKCCLIHFIDDATNDITAGKFVPTEGTEGYLECLKEHLEKHGRPLGLYVDKHTIFKVSKEELKKGIGITHFGKVLKDLDIELICAHSPQAKGRIERSNGVLQDRLIKEMRLEKINTIEQANAFLPGFLKKYNNRFRKEAANPANAHRAMRKQDNLERIFSREDRRRLSKDLTFQHHGNLYLIETNTPNRMRHAYVEVFWRGSQPIEVEYNGRKLKYKLWEERVYQQPKTMDVKEIGASWANSKKLLKPAKSHPWR